MDRILISDQYILIGTPRQCRQTVYVFLAIRCVSSPPHTLSFSCLAPRSLLKLLLAPSLLKLSVVHTRFPPPTPATSTPINVVVDGNRTQSFHSWARLSGLQTQRCRSTRELPPARPTNGQTIGQLKHIPQRIRSLHVRFYPPLTTPAIFD